MSHYTTNQRIFILEHYISSDKSCRSVQLAYKREYKSKNAPMRDTIHAIYEKFKRTGSVLDDVAGHSGRKPTETTEENIQKVAEIFKRSPRKSIRKAAQEAGMKRSSVHRILKRDLNLFAYKIQTHQPLSEASKAKRIDFANNVSDMAENLEIDVGDIWFTDEAHFYLDGFVNKQNWRFWGSTNPHITESRSLHPKRTTAWAAISSKGIIGPFFIEETVTSARYKNILQNFFIPALQGMMESTDLESAWFQQDGARPHRTDEVFEVISEYFGNRVMALDYKEFNEEGIDWPPYSPDLNPCDFFLWGYLKDRVYANRPRTILELKDAISDEIQSIPAETFRKVAENFGHRIRHVIEIEGGHFEHIVT